MFPNDSLPRPIEGFDFLERLGAGAAGEVYLARSRGGQLVAIKTIARAGEDGAGDETLHREASVCARLHHPCIVEMRAFLEQPGFSALVFEYVPGVALARVLRVCESRGVRLPDGAGWHIVHRVLTALAYAHAFRDEDGRPTPIVHRDLSPSNVLLDWRGGVKIADYGIAKVLGVSPATRFGLVKGTLGCMAPEQARGEPVDERADVYAAALLAWRLSTGRVPFAKHQGDEFELLRAMRNPRIPPLGALRPDLPVALLEATSAALEADPSRRTLAAADFAAGIAAHFDLRDGEEELSALLRRFRPAIEMTLKRGRGADPEGHRSKLEHTMRYEEAALVFDEEPRLDERTFETHALPASQHTEVAPVSAPDSEPSLAPPSALPAVELSEEGRARPTAVGAVARASGAIAAADPAAGRPRARAAGMWGYVLLVALVATVLVALGLWGLARKLHLLDSMQ
jgi:serine/threonine protein kinase